ncbi:MAG: ScpA family protein [Candidatus Falkowbacteria bacterium]
MIIQLDKFQGPLSLLLQLIEKEEMDIAEVSLAKIADQYIAYLKTVECNNPEEMADFLVVAAKLLLIKAKALLPFLQPEEEEEIEEFEQQLRMYQEFLEASKKIQAMLSEHRFMFARPFNRKAIVGIGKQFSPPKLLTKDALGSVFSELLTRLRPAQELLREETLERKIHIEERILAIQNSLIKQASIGFNKIVAEAQNNTEIIVSFLALLELVRMREVTVGQGELFGEIEISRV